MSTVVAKGPAITRDEKLEVLVDKYQVSLLKVCFTFLRDRSLAEDAVQETFTPKYEVIDYASGKMVTMSESALLSSRIHPAIKQHGHNRNGEKEKYLYDDGGGFSKRMQR